MIRAGTAAAAAPQENLGSGGYGFVISPALQNNVAGVATNFPTNVTKVFYEKDAYDKAVATIPTVPIAMGVNEGHRTNRYTRPYTGSILKPSLLINYGIGSTDPIYLLRMPNLGKNFEQVDKYLGEARSIQLDVILAQIQKLLTQLQNLSATGYIHGDIRQTNIMFKPDTGVMTIIDFDWLLPLDEFNKEYSFAYGFYSNPPESIIVRNLYESTDPMAYRRISTAEWADVHFKSFKNFYKAIGIKDKSSFADTVRSANTDNAALIDATAFRNPERAAKTIMLPKFDAFGLAVTLLEFLTVVYTPKIITDELTSTTIGRLRAALTRIGITKGGVAYTPVELNAYSKALLGVVNIVLRPLARSRVLSRITPAKALGRMGVVMTELGRDLTGPSGAAAGAVASHAAARRTRRCRRGAAKSRRAARW